MEFHSLILQTFLIFFLSDKNNEKRFFCSGSLINENYVLTAAHCFIKFQKEFTLDTVIVGEYDMSTEIDCNVSGPDECAPPVQVRGILQLIIHENFSEATLKNDIALIRLDKPVVFNQNVIPICLPIDSYTNELLATYSFTVAGWDRIGDKRNGGRKTVFQGAVNPKQCQSSLSRVKKDAIFDWTQICVAPERGAAAITNSGGPLLGVRSHYSHKTSRWHLIGVTSFATSRHDEEEPLVYTRVEEYIEWILNKLEP